MPGEIKSPNGCKPCKRKLPVTDRPNHAGWITGLLLALLPKCPFCLLAFSSTLLLCGKDGTQLTSHTTTSGTTIFSSAILCFIIVMSIVMNNRKDFRTRYALLLALAGTAGILNTETRGGGIFLYYFSVITIFGAVWLNGSLFFFLSWLRGHFRNRTVSQQH